MVSRLQRSLVEVFAEILQEARNGVAKTRIKNSCNLTYSMTGDCIDYLLEAGLLRRGKSFHTTDKGRQFLRIYQTLVLLTHTRN